MCVHLQWLFLMLRNIVASTTAKESLKVSIIRTLSLKYVLEVTVRKKISEQLLPVCIFEE